MRRRLLAMLGTAAVVLSTGVAAVPVASHADTTQPLWLVTVNHYRAEAGLPAVVEDPTLSAKDLLHARYLAGTQTLTHFEDPASPYYTTDGDWAGQHSDLAEGRFVDQSAAVDDWMHAPFHALGVLRPTVTAMGYAQVTDAHGMVWAALDVLSDQGPMPALTWPVMWPNPTSSSHLLAYNGEIPDLLTACPGYGPVAGLPIIVDLGPSAAVPSGVTATLSSGGVTLPSCEVDESNYSNPDGNAQTLGRTILGENHTILVIAHDPLKPVTSYALHVVAGSTTVDDSFTTDRGTTTIDLQKLSATGYDGVPVWVGGFVDSDFGPLPGRKVNVLSGSTVVASTTTRSDGSWIAQVKPEGPTRYVAQFPGDASWLPSTSAVGVLTSAARPTSLQLYRWATRVHRGHYVKLTAILIDVSTNTLFKGGTVSLYAKPSGKSWRLVSSGRSDSRGHVNWNYLIKSTTVFQLKYRGTTTYPRHKAVTSKTGTVRAV